MFEGGNLEVTPAIVSAARDLVFANIDLSRIACAPVGPEGDDAMLVGLIAYGSLLIAAARKLGVTMQTALQVSHAVLGGHIPPSESVN
jgi:hypothetical protein